MKTVDIDKNAKLVWDFMHMHHEIKKADAIFVLCSLDTRVASYAAELYLQGYAKWVIVSGGAGKFTKGIFTKSEAEVFADIIIAAGVPKDKMIIEDKSTNTGENIRFTYELLQKTGHTFSSFILVQKPYMERRTFATFKKQWPDSTTKITITSPKLNYDDYFTDHLNKEFVINIMVGDLQRIREYPKRGFQIEQNIPDNVLRACHRLISAGFTKHLI